MGLSSYLHCTHSEPLDIWGVSKRAAQGSDWEEGENSLWWMPPAQPGSPQLCPTLWGCTGTPPCRELACHLHGLSGRGQLKQGCPGDRQQVGAKAKQQISCLSHMLFLSWTTESPTAEGIFNEVLCPIQISPAWHTFSGRDLRGKQWVVEEMEKTRQRQENLRAWTWKFMEDPVPAGQGERCGGSLRGQGCHNAWPDTLIPWWAALLGRAALIRRCCSGRGTRKHGSDPALPWSPALI